MGDRWRGLLPPLVLLLLCSTFRSVDAQCGSGGGSCGTPCYGDCCYNSGICTSATSGICANEFPTNTGFPPSYGEKLTSHAAWPNDDGCICATANTTVYQSVRLQFATSNLVPGCATSFYGNASTTNCWGTLQCLGSGTCTTTGICRVRGLFILSQAKRCL